MSIDIKAELNSPRSVAWIVWTPTSGDYDNYGVVVYAKTRGVARSAGGAEMNLDFQEALNCRVLRAPKADHLAESCRQPDADLMIELGFIDWEHH